MQTGFGAVFSNNPIDHTGRGQIHETDERQNRTFSTDQIPKDGANRRSQEGDNNKRNRQASSRCFIADFLGWIDDRARPVTGLHRHVACRKVVAAIPMEPMVPASITNHPHAGCAEIGESGNRP